MGNFKSFWIFGFEWWGGLRPEWMKTAEGKYFKPLFLGLWIRVKRLNYYRREYINYVYGPNKSVDPGDIPIPIMLLLLLINIIAIFSFLK